MRYESPISGLNAALETTYAALEATHAAMEATYAAMEATSLERPVPTLYDVDIDTAWEEAWRLLSQALDEGERLKAQALTEGERRIAKARAARKGLTH